MRILHLDPDDMDNPYSGGGPVRTYEIYRRLAARHEITVLTPTFEGSQPERIRDGIRYVRLGRKVGNHGSSHHLTFLAALPRAVRRFDYDLLVEDTMPPCSTTWTPWFARRSSPLISSVQWWHAYTYTQRLKLPFHWGQQRAVRSYDHFVVLTDQMRKTILAANPKANCRVIANGIDSDLFDQPIGIPGALGQGILYVGRIEIGAKGLDLLMAAVGSIAPERRPHLTIAGLGPSGEQRALDKLIDQHHLRGSVTQVGKVTAAERNRLLQACRFLVMPSRMETFGMTIAEANAAGRAALTFDIGPMNEVSSAAVPRVAAFDIAAYGRGIGRLMSMPDAELIDMGRACRAWARQYDWDKVAAAQEAFYGEVLRAHADRGTRA